MDNADTTMFDALNQPERLAALAQYEIFDTEAEAGFDGLAMLAAQICDTPAGAITFVDRTRFFCKALIGFPADRTAPVEAGLCPLVVRDGLAELVIPDTLADPAYATVPVAIAGIRFYAGVPLVSPEGHVLGTICALDFSPRPRGITGTQLDGLKMLAAQTVSQLNLRRAEAYARRAGERAERHSHRLALLAEASAVLLSAPDTNTMARGIYALLAGPFDLDMSLLHRCESGSVGLVAAFGLDDDQKAQVQSLEFATTVCGIVAETRQAVNLSGLLSSDKPEAQPFKALGIDTYASMPLLAGDELLGTLSFGRRSKLFSVGEAEVLLTMAANVAMALRRLRAEEELRASEAALQAIFDTVPVGIVIGEAPSGRVIRANRQAEAIFGHVMPAATGIESYKTEWHARHPDGRRVDSYEYPMAQVLAGAERAELEVLYPRGADREAWIRLIAAPIRTDGRLVAGVAAVLDVDRERRAMEALDRVRENLEARVGEEIRSREAVQARLAHAQRMEALGKLAGGIAHDFNNVLQAVQGGAALIERRPGDVESVRRLARMVVEASGRGASITRRLLAFSRRGDLRAEPVDAASLLPEISEILAHTLGAGMAIRVEIPAGLKQLLADKGQLETVLINLGTNARDACGGNGTLTLSAAPEALRHDHDPEAPGTLRAGSYIRLSVADSGSGMDAETLSRASEPFFTTKRPGEGTGLGLAMARGFAEQSDGGLFIESEPGKGTVVSLWFPVADGAPHSARSDAWMNGAGDARGRLLLVDDDGLVLETLAEQMEAAGYAVLTAKSGAAALEVLNTGEAVGLLVSDLSMPGMDGLTLVREAQCRRPGLPAILLTGFATNTAEIAVAGAVSGTFSLLRKPIEAKHLAERVAVILEATRVRA